MLRKTSDASYSLKTVRMNLPNPEAVGKTAWQRIASLTPANKLQDVQVARFEVRGWVLLDRSVEEYEADLEESEKEAVMVGLQEYWGRKYYLFKGILYEDDEDLTAEEVTALLLERLRKRQAKITTAVASMKGQHKQKVGRRKAISDAVKIQVWQRDNGRCSRCGSNKNLEYDHIIPLAKGGANTMRNLQLLCEDCNRSKGANII